MLSKRLLIFAGLGVDPIGTLVFFEANTNGSLELSKGTVPSSIGSLVRTLNH